MRILKLTPCAFFSSVVSKMSKTVLVSYQDRHTIANIPISLKDSQDIEYLEAVVRKKFLLASNVHVEVVFQKFDPEWQEYVDLEKNTVLDQKEKLKMVITPIIVTPSPTGTSLPEVIQVSHYNYIYSRPGLIATGLLRVTIYFQ